jgi:multidrug efflux system membrane fusion protein
MKVADSAAWSAGLLIALALLCGCGPGKDGSHPETAVPVRTAAVMTEDTSPPIHTSGRLSSALEARLSFTTGGIIARFNVDEGETVDKGGIIVSLKLDEIEARASQARTAFDKAKRDYARAANLYADSVIALESMQDAESGLKTAGAALEIAEFNLDHSVIRAPADGQILRRYAEANELVGPGQPVVLFGTTGAHWVLRAAVNEQEVLRLGIGDPAAARFDAYPDTSFRAETTEIAESAGPMTGGYEIELSLDDAGLKLMSGFVADIDIFPREGGRYSAIPVDALVEADGSRGWVYRVDHETMRARAVPVVIHHIIGSRVAVSSGLEGVDEVVTDGAQYLADSSLVSIVE